MRNKKTTYLLIVLVVLIWGAIVFRIIKQMQIPDLPEMVYLPVALADNYFQKDSVYKLSLKYYDPFLKGNYSNTKSSNNMSVVPTRRNINQRINPKNKSKKEEQVLWPEIQFSGLIINDKTHDKLGLVIVNAESYLIKPGEKRDEVTLEKLYTDSIKVSFKDKFKTIEKSN